MNIKFEDEGLIVQNLQIFLKEESNKHLNLSSVYDIDTHKALIQYLKQPNTADVRVVKEEIIKKFTYREQLPPYALVEGGGILNFDNKIVNDEIWFYTRPLTQYFNGGTQFIDDHIDELQKFVHTMGWNIDAYTKAATNTTQTGIYRAEIHIVRTGIINKFPNKTVLQMVNLFDGTYLYNRAFRSDSSFDNVLQFSDNYKVAIVPCEPGDSFTITHGYAFACEMVIGYTTLQLRDLKKVDSFVEGVVNRTESSNQGPVTPGRWETYTIPEDSNATYLLVQMPFRNDLQAMTTNKVRIYLGDVNGDGVVNSTDVSLLNQWVTANEQNRPLPFELVGNSLIAANVNGDYDLDGKPIVNRTDVTLLQLAVENSPTGEANLGYTERETPLRVSPYELDRLLVMDGIVNEDPDLNAELYNIPVDQFYIEPWAVHSKFIEYFLGRVIHPYSDIEDIAWLQENIKHMYPYHEKFTGYYDSIEDYLTDDYFEYDTLNSRWKYYRGDQYSGYWTMPVLVNGVETNTDLTNCYLRHDDGRISHMEIKNGRFYVDQKWDGRTVIGSGPLKGKISNPNSSDNLVDLIRKFQLDTNKYLGLNNVPSDQQIKWTDGYYDVTTDKEFVKLLNSTITYINGAFR